MSRVNHPNGRIPGAPGKDALDFGSPPSRKLSRSPQTQRVPEPAPPPTSPNPHINTFTALPKPFPVNQMPPHLPHPPGISQGTRRHSKPTQQRNPLKLLGSVQHNCADELCQLENRYEAVFHAGEGGAVRGRSHGLCELLGSEIVDPETEAGDGEEEEEDEGQEWSGSEMAEDAGDKGWEGGGCCVW